VYSHLVADPMLLTLTQQNQVTGMTDKSGHLRNVIVAAFNIGHLKCIQSRPKSDPRYRTFGRATTRRICIMSAKRVSMQEALNGFEEALGRITADRRARGLSQPWTITYSEKLHLDKALALRAEGLVQLKYTEETLPRELRSSSSA
jgi:hypothetical protein